MLELDELTPAAANFSPFDLPSPFGHYRVEREIATGGIGMVYEAEDTRLGRRVALKMLRQVLFATEGERQRFKAEAALASHLEHPNIVPVHEVGVLDGQPYFTMKLIGGTDLAKRLAAERLPVRQGVDLLAKVAGAVHYAHQRGVLHRDLKPANILLDEAGEPWLTDFGIAKWLGADSSQTLTNMVMGTPDYMSPEQAAGRQSEVSIASDVWSLGVILYELLTGRRPFKGETAHGTIGLAAERDPVRPSTVIRGLDPDLETLCLRCLEKDPARRPSGAGELAEELQRWLRGEPIHARPVTFPERLGKWARRHPWRAGLSSALLLTILGGTAGVTWQWRRATENERRATENAERALASAAAERRTSYSAVLAQAQAAREHHDFGQARRLVRGIAPEFRGFDWRLLQSLCRGDQLQAWPFDAEPQCLTLTPDGKHIAIITVDGWLHLRDLHGKEMAAPRMLPAEADQDRHYRGLTFSPDGRRLAYSCNDMLRVIIAADLTVLYEESSLLPQCAWLDDDRLLYGFNGSVARPSWPEAGAWILNFHGITASGADIPRTGFPQMCAPLAVSPDRRSFVLHRVEAIPESWKRSLHVYHVDGDFTTIPAPLYSFPGREYPGVLAFSATGKFLAFSAGPSLRQSARVLEVAGGRVLFDHEFRFPIHSVAMGPEERRLALVGGDSVVRLYDFTRSSPAGLNTGIYDNRRDPARCQPLDGRGAHDPPADLSTRTAQDGRARFYLGHEKQVSDVTFDATGSLFTAGADGSLCQWPAAVPHPSVRVGHMTTAYVDYHPAASPDGQKVLFAQTKTAWLLDVALSRGAENNVTLPVADQQAPLAVLKNGSVITQDIASTEIFVWKLEGGRYQESKRLIGNWPHGNHSGRTRRGVLSQNEQRLAGSMEGILFSADLAQGTLRWDDPAGERASRYANHDLSPDGEWIATSDYGPRVTIHRFSGLGKIVATLAGEPRGYDTAVVFSRDGRRLYTGNEDGRIRVWDTATWEPLPALAWPAHRSVVTALAVSHDGALVATSGDDTLKLFPVEPEPGEPYRRERVSFRLDQPANWIQFARSETGQDRALLHCSPGGTLEVWETDDPCKPDHTPAAPGNLPLPLGGHDAILLPDGKILVAGGMSVEGVPLSGCLLYHPDDATWSATGPMATPRHGLKLLPLAEGRVLAVGGTGLGNAQLSSCEIFHPSTGTWIATGSLAAAVSNKSFVALANGAILAVGGQTNGRPAATCELYDPATGIWTATGSLLTPRFTTALALLANGKVLAAGGAVPGGGDPPDSGTARCELYDPATQTWSPTGALGEPRSGAAAITLTNGKILLSGDQQRPGFACYNPATAVWESIPSPDQPRAFASVTLLPDGKLLVAGGTGIPHPFSPTQTAFLFDPDTSRWSPAPDLPVPRMLHTATLLKNGKLLLTGGRDASNAITQRVDVIEPR